MQVSQSSYNPVNASIQYSNASLLPGSGHPANVLSVTPASWRRIRGDPASVSTAATYGNQPAGVVETEFVTPFQWNETIEPGNSVFPTFTSPEANIIQYKGSYPIRVNVCVSLYATGSTNPADLLLHLLAVVNHTENEIDVYSIASTAAELSAHISAQTAIFTMGRGGLVYGNGVLNLNPNDTISFYISSHSSYTGVLSVFGFSVQIRQV